MPNHPTVFEDLTLVLARNAEVPNASWDNGMSYGAANSPGIGIADGNPGLDESLPSWTLLDQFGAARDPQLGQSIGWPQQQDIEFVENANTALGILILGKASLADLATGWVADLALGAEIVTNGSFVDATGWTTSGGWSISGGHAIADGTPGALTQTVTITPGQEYQLQFAITTETAASTGIAIRLGESAAIQANVKGLGLHTLTVVAGSGNSLLEFLVPTQDAFVGEITTVSLKPIL